MELLTIATGSSTGNCHLIHDDKTDHYLMLDCGAKVSWDKIKCYIDFKISAIDGILITHRHNDHCPNVKRISDNFAIQCYGSEDIRRYATEKYGGWTFVLNDRKESILWGGWRVVPWTVPHTDPDGKPVHCFAYYIVSPSGHRLVYITDFMDSPFTFKKIKAQTILVACNHDSNYELLGSALKIEHMIRGHSCLSTVNDLVMANKTEYLRNVILCHLSWENANPRMMQRTIKRTVGAGVNVRVAQPGKRIDLNKYDHYEEEEDEE